MNQGERWKVYRMYAPYRDETKTVWLAKRIDGGESRPFNTWKAAYGWADHRVRERAAQSLRKYNLEKIVAQSSRDRLHHNHCPDCRCC